MRRTPLNSGLIVALLVLAGCDAGRASEESAKAPAAELALFGSIPIYWGEGGDVADMLSGDVPEDWVRTALERHYALVPLDALEDDTLAGKQRLLLAQPRPLAPSENVALDKWVRAGGQALILADPMLTRESQYPIGDRRRPQDVVLLSPILTRWGLELRFDEKQDPNPRTIADGASNLPVRMAGEFAVKPGADAADCTLRASRVIARCQIGWGVVTLVADAAILDAEEAGTVPERQRQALDALVTESFAN